MSKLVDVEKIKAEIGKLLESAKMSIEDYLPDEFGHDMLSERINCLEGVLSLLDTIPEERQENLIDQAIYWFKVIAEDMERLTSGNMPHNAAVTKGRAVRAYKFLEEHKNDTIPENCQVIKGWLARDKSEGLNFHEIKPYCRSYGAWLSSGYELPLETEFFPEITWESEPMEIEILIKKV